MDKRPTGRIAHMQPRSSTLMPPPPALGSKPLLHVGPWQEYALSALLARMRSGTMEDVMEAMQSMGLAPALSEGVGLGTPVSGAVSPVDSYAGSISSARSERSVQSAKSASSSRTNRTDPSSWSSSRSGASANAALFRRARNLKYKGPNYDKPWNNKVPHQKTTKEREVERRKNMYAKSTGAAAPGAEVAGAPALPGLPEAAVLAGPLHGRRAQPHTYVPQLAKLHSSPSAHRAHAVAQPVPARTHQASGFTSPVRGSIDSLDEHLRSPQRALRSPMSLPRTPASPKGDEEVDDLLNWADGIDMANISQEFG
jgi:hypothetical protein